VRYNYRHVMPGRRRSPSVFISHSAHDDPGATRAVAALRRALKAAGFEPLVDEWDLKGGDDWRQRLYTWMTHCDAAILLLSRNALQSDWVLQEATVLTARRFDQARNDAVNEPFLLLPVLVGVTMRDVKALSAFEELNLPSIQALHDRQPAQLATRVAKLLMPLKRRASSRRSLRQDLEDKIASNLRVASAAVLRNAAEELGDPPSRWVPSRDAADILAMRLIESERDLILASLQRLQGAIPSENLRNIVKFLRGAWVNAAAAARFAVIAASPAHTRAAVLNARHTSFTPFAYVTRASGSTSEATVIPVVDAGGEDYLGSIVRQIKEHFRDPEMLDADALANIRRQVAKMTKAAPVVIAVAPPVARAPLIGEHDVGELLKQFEQCTVLIMSGQAPPPVNVLPQIRRVAPALRDGEETDAYDWYRAIRDMAR
jgi:hypothetical protein